MFFLDCISGKIDCIFKFFLKKNAAGIFKPLDFFLLLHFCFSTNIGKLSWFSAKTFYENVARKYIKHFNESITSPNLFTNLLMDQNNLWQNWYKVFEGCYGINTISSIFRTYYFGQVLTKNGISRQDKKRYHYLPNLTIMFRIIFLCTVPIFV